MTTTEQSNASAPLSDATESDIAEYLRTHPEFFQRHRELTAELAVPHDSGSATSLIEHQVKVLRDEKRTLRYRLDELLRVARDNDRLAGQLHRLTVELLELRDLDAVIASVCDGLRSDFRADVVELQLIGEAPASAGCPLIEPSSTAAANLREAFSERRPRVGRLSQERLRLAFGEAATELASAAVLPLDDGPVEGVLAIGSRDPARYDDDQGTVFLSRLSELVARILRGTLERGY